MDGVALKLFDPGGIEELRREVKRQRDQMEGLIEAESAGYWDWHIKENYEFMSPRFKSMFGYAEDELENSPDARRRIIHPDDLPKLLESFEAHVNSKGKVPYDNEVRYYHKDGSIVWVICRGSVVEWSEHGEPIRMMGVHMDITALKRREEEIREVRRYAFIAAHDLMQPTNTVLNSLSALSDDHEQVASQEKDKILEMGTTAAKRLQSRISALLDYSRLEKKELPFDTMDMNAIVRDCISDMQPQIEASGADISVAPLPCAYGAETLVSQVVHNLLGNAMKYCREEGPLRIEISGEETSDAMVTFRVADNGIGIKPEHRRNVFDMFTRLHSEEDYSGNGLGLSLCERLIVRHGGRIMIEDGIDGGVAVVFKLKQVPSD